jgi:hypothetical protein
MAYVRLHASRLFIVSRVDKVGLSFLEGNATIARWIPGLGKLSLLRLCVVVFFLIVFLVVGI